MNVWITKYALERGIFEVVAEVCDSGNCVSYEEGDYKEEIVHGEGIDWHKSYDSAAARAEEMINQKITEIKAIGF